MPKLRHVNLRNAGQLKADCLLYMVEKCQHVVELQLGATNLVHDSAWQQLFEITGPQLESFKISHLNDAFGDDILKLMAERCSRLQRLKLASCTKITSLVPIASMSTLRHLSLSVAQETSSATLTDIVADVGLELRTLSLHEYPEMEDDILKSIHDTCNSLTKLRLTGSTNFTDKAFADLFDSWPNPPLRFADFSNDRDMDTGNPDGDAANIMGFGPSALIALMAHSGVTIEKLDLSSDRHITHEALTEVFNGKTTYSNLIELNLSFVMQVDEVVMTGIFKSCPKLRKLVVFACFNAKGATIPAGVAVIGLPNAQDNVVIEGDFTGDVMDLTM